MNLRLHERVPADIEIGVTNLSQCELHASGWILDASKSGIALLMRVSFAVGDMLRLDFEDCQLFGHVIYIHDENGLYRTGVAVEEVLLGRSDLGKLVEALAGEAATGVVATPQE